MNRFRDSTGLAALRAGAHILRERISRRRVTSRDEVPSSVAALTPAWWTAVLCAGVPRAAVLDFAVIAADSGTHQRHRFALTYNEAGRAAGLPTALFTKTLPTLTTRMIGGFNGSARAEGRFYRELRPALAIEAPLGHHAASDPRSLAAINVLEDIATTRGATFCSADTRVDRAMAEDMVDTLASLHAHRFGDATLGAAHPWLARFDQWFAIGARKMRTEHYTQQAIARLAERLPSALVERRHEIWPATTAAAAIHRREPQSLLHSDVHIGNWYQRANGAMGLCDWQCVSLGHGSRDLAYALATALAPEDRRAWERELVSRYASRLQDLAHSKLDANEMFTHYRAQMLHALWMWTITLCHSRWLPAMQPEATSIAMIERIALAITELDSLDAADAEDASAG